MPIPLFIISSALGFSLLQSGTPATAKKDSLDIYIPQNSALNDTLLRPTVTIYQDFNKPVENTVADGLSTEPGLAVSQDGFWNTSLYIRGISEKRTFITVDGFPIFTSSDMVGVLSTFHPENINKIEITKGAGAVVCGAGASGGTINLVSESPDFTDQAEWHGHAGSEFSSVNNMAGIHASLDYSQKNWYLSVYGNFRSAGNMCTSAGNISNSGFHDASWGLKGAVVYRPDQVLKVTYQHFKAWDAGVPFASFFPAAASVKYKNIERRLLAGEYIFSDVTDELREVRIKLYTQSFDTDLKDKENETTIYFPSTSHSVYGAKITADWKLTDYRAFLLGADGSVSSVNSLRVKQTENNDGSYNLTGTQLSPAAKVYDAALFGEFSWKIRPNKWLTTLGARLDYIKQTNDTAFSPWFVTNNTASYSSAYHPDYDYSKRKALFYPETDKRIVYSAHADLAYLPSKRQRITLSLGSSYRVASIEERFNFIQVGSVTYYSNSELKPENAYTSNLNYTFNGKNFRFKTDVFVDLMDNMIAEVRTTGNTYENENISKVLFTGAETEFNWIITSYLNLYGNAAFTRARNTRNDKNLPEVPPLKGVVSMDVQPVKIISGTISAAWAAKQDKVAENEKTTDGYIILNVSAHTIPLKWNRSNIRLAAGVDNLLDKTYYNHLTSYRSGAIRFAEPGRNVYVKLNIGW